MIHLNLSISNPWSYRWKSIRSWSGSTPIKNKFWEIHISKNNELIGIVIDITHRKDHAGVNLSLSLFGYGIEFNFYDNRHWDRKKNNWHYY